MNRMNFCVLRNKSLSRERKQPTIFLSVYSCKHAEEELTRCVVDNNSGKCKARSAGDEAPCVDNDSGKADFASDDVPVAVPSSLSTLKSPATRKRRNASSLIPSSMKLFPLPWASTE